MELEDYLSKRKKDLESKIYRAVRSTSLILYNSVERYEREKDPLYLIEATSYLFVVSRYVIKLASEYVAIDATSNILSRFGRIDESLVKYLKDINHNSK